MSTQCYSLEVRRLKADKYWPLRDRGTRGRRVYSAVFEGIGLDYNQRLQISNRWVREGVGGNVKTSIRVWKTWLVGLYYHRYHHFVVVVVVVVNIESFSLPGAICYYCGFRVTTVVPWFECDVDDDRPLSCLKAMSHVAVTKKTAHLNSIMDAIDRRAPLCDGRLTHFVYHAWVTPELRVSALVGAYARAAIANYGI